MLDKGSAGTLGVGKKPWKVHVYEKSRPVKTAVEAAEEERRRAEAAVREPERPRDLPGEVFVRMGSEGAFLKVTKPQGRGPRASEVMAFEKLSLRGVANYDTSLVSRVVKHADGEYIRVADIRYDPSHDATVSIEITDGEMKAVIVVTEPGPGGADVSVDFLESFLQSKGVVFGVKEDALREFESSPRYGRPVVVAEGAKARDGADARITYAFKGQRESVKLKERDGRVDFKDISRVENVVVGQLLASKVPAEPGQPGQTVTGKQIPAEKGKDCDLAVGKNVKLSEDGLSALAETNGQVLLLGGKVNVEPIYTVAGNVDLRTGNVLFLGTVVVRGNVEDGFAVKAAGQHRSLRERREMHPGRRRGHRRAPGNCRKDGGQGALRQEPLLEVHRACARGRRGKRRGHRRHRPLLCRRKQDDPLPGQKGSDRRRTPAGVGGDQLEDPGVGGGDGDAARGRDTTRGARRGSSSLKRRGGKRRNPWKRSS